MIEKLTVGALQSKYWGSSLARGQEKLSRSGAKIATLLLVERRESSQHRVRKSGENLVPKECYTLVDPILLILNHIIYNFSRSLWFELLRVNIIFSGKEMIESKEKNHDKVRVIQIFRVIWSYVKH